MKRFFKHLTMLLLVIVLLAALPIQALAATATLFKSNSDPEEVPYTDEQIQKLTALLQQPPKESEYLDEPCLGKVDNKGRAAFGFTGPSSGAAKSFSVPDEEELTVVAYNKANNRYCVIVNSRNQACWINAARVTLSPVAQPFYTDDEIRQIIALLERAPKESEYLDEPCLGKVDNNGRAAFGFTGPSTGADKSFSIPDEEELTVVAYNKANNRYCVIVNSRSQACWINAARVSLFMY